ncbi:isoleucine--tRNA ligase [Candidatus Saccharibacteria bacterium]|nr:MAG: isoleucine--tRNA ligase [Candidatus Saccharibacteria bacterium]
MKFKAGQRRKALEYEKDLVKQWKRNKTFEKSVENRSKDNAYVFYDGPPFITGVPHHGTLLSSIVKDAVPRYWTMQGKRVERVWGWDCHGLPAEVFTEKKLGIQDKRDIGTKISLEEYITTCRDNMVQTGNLWEDTIDRIGRWVDFRGAYKTMDKHFMESVWWAFQKLYNEGKIYEGEKVLLYCTRDATPISKAEVAMDNSYQDVTDPSVFVKFKLKDEYTYLLAWTTTPWTLNANTAIGVGENQTYVEVAMADGTHLVLLKDLVSKVLTDERHQLLEYEIVREIPGKELVGKEYEPLLGVHRGENAHKVWNYPGLSTEEGSGIVHLAPAYGEEDYALSKANGFPFVIDIDDSGFYTEGEWKGQNVWEANKPIAKELKERGVVWKIDYVKHSYPHCHRCGTKLMYRAHPSWFMDIAGQREAMLEQNENINWFPAHVKHGRFEKTVESAPDWNLSRDRFWATAMPVWKSEDGDVKVVGSYAELKELSGVELDDYHRPWVDDIEFDFEGKHYKRIDKVLDCWFESGSMPFAQFHYPFENKEKFEQGFPGDFIAEYVGQVRAWFYYLHSVSIGLFGENSFKNVIVTGTVAGNDGRKMSKSFGNFTDPNELMDQYSADALRFLLLSSPLLNGEDFSLQDKDVQDVQRKLAMVWNMYDFFTMYADVDEWEWDGSLEDPSAKLTNPLDVWVVSRLHQLQAHVTEKMEGYDIPGALEFVLPFLDDASNWYVRRSRRRFWKSGDDSDKNDAYTTLHYVLVRLSMVLAPFTPFLAEELYQKLTSGESVHLLDWPKAGAVDEAVLASMAQTRQVIEQGLSLRMQKSETEQQVKVRQPLSELTYGGEKLSETLEQIIAEEVNVKKVTHGDAVTLNKEITPELKREGLMRELIRQVQTARKAAGLNVDDRIVLEVVAEDEEVAETLKEHGETIQAETLATSLAPVADGYETTAKVDGFDIAIRLKKA